MRAKSLIWRIGVFLLWLTSPRAVPASEPNADVSDLKGKYVLVVLRNKQIYALEKIQLRNLGNQAFLGGNRLYLGSSKEGEAGYSVWVSMADVWVFHVFASVDDLKKTKGAQNAALQFDGSVTAGTVPPNEPPAPRVQPEKQIEPRGEWVALAGAISLVTFFGGLLIGWRWHGGRTAATAKAAA